MNQWKPHDSAVACVCDSNLLLFHSRTDWKTIKDLQRTELHSVQVDPVIIYGVDCFIVNPSTVFLCPKGQKPDFTDLTIVYHGGLIIHNLDFPADLVN